MVLALVSCTTGPMEPGRRALEAKHQAWVELSHKSLVTDRIYELTDQGDVLPIMIDALPLDDQVLAKIRELWGDDPRLKGKIDSWLAKGRIVVLAGLYTRDVTEDDLMKNNRFRFSLRTGGGLKTEPKAKEIVKGSLIEDYFQIFNPWAKVVALSFDGLWDQNPVLVLDWPYGSREVALVQGARP
jgi:hypothetical protein